jgi:uncharacterized iron-regulated membrane protein
VHQGQEYGALNRYIMLAGCIAIVLLTISAPVMWWKRRPKGSFGLPPAAGNRRAAVTVMAIMAIAGLVYPLPGFRCSPGSCLKGCMTWRSARSRGASGSCNEDRAGWEAIFK